MKGIFQSRDGIRISDWNANVEEGGNINEFLNGPLVFLWGT